MSRKKRPNRGFVIIPLLVFVILALCVFGIYYVYCGEEGKTCFWEKGVSNENSIVSIEPLKVPFVNREEPTPTPFPFNDLTVPFLRTKNFDSTLTLGQKISENASYTSYLASYTSDGFNINGLLTQPKAEIPGGKHPAIVFVHGYIPPEAYKTRVNYLSYIDYLAKNGFVVFKIDLRGHDQSEGEAGGGYYSGDYITDTLSAYNALQKSNFVNPEKIGLWGHSMAGNVVFRSLIVKKDIPAVVIWAGAGYTYTDLREYQIDDNSYRPPPENSERAKKRKALRDAYGEFDPNHWFWKQVPGTNYLDGVEGAVQLNHATNDNVVSIDYSRNLVKFLAPSKIKYELKEYAGGGHNITGPFFNEAMKNTSEFFKEKL